MKMKNLISCLNNQKLIKVMINMNLNPRKLMNLIRLIRNWKIMDYKKPS